MRDSIDDIDIDTCIAKPSTVSRGYVQHLVSGKDRHGVVFSADGGGLLIGCDVLLASVL